ncbi:thaumatin-like protein [Auriscalpium vulgare]|uniref:Thaumatin-like protein n=1 Tax=Auriscalpium vulgare TaxID=40419 RepID=A0ACB8RK18_9AGAM|nr:thaumatin-like protein [Auriscalpium vulgare]
MQGFTPLAIFLLLSALFSTVLGRTLTVYNGCPFTVWPAMFTDLNVGSARPNYPTGWEAAAYTHVTFTVPDNWRAGRIWGRRNCNFSGNNGANACLDGGCNGGLQCDSNTGTGVPPVTLAEFTLSTASSTPDFYDVSLVDGFNLPMSITPTGGCHVANCPHDLGPNCPAALKGPYDSTGYPVGCKSACQVDPNPQNSPNCCSGSHNTPSTCPSSGVQYYSYFKSNCPNSYVYAYDESSGTALWSCPSGTRADYTVTFCPP